ncbi:MFS transporter [Bifidobacterium dolichotidis]|uniref:MFS transporter n=1 Tax=Bifidobacterium dolichotidis TaxID=2306976 RepID=A0A430FRL5_9BIFI|nr:sugar porter family MFS transporter [Bifidobacterium dolichotidis]RSX55497.1 MFS transporter [Bifidobacterium dolichotidis]
MENTTSQSEVIETPQVIEAVQPGEVVHPKETSSLKYVIILAVSAGFAGLLYGYDTVSISGAITYLTALWNLGTGIQGLIVSSIMIGGIVGVGVSGFISDRVGRKPVLLSGAILFFFAAIWSALAMNPGTLIAARIVGGLGIGLSSSQAITYITECAPAKNRGFLSSMYQFLCTIGILLTNIINFFIAAKGGIHSDFANQAWRWMLAIGALPALVLVFALVLMPESPRFLLQRGHKAAGMRVLERINGPEAAQREAKAIEKSLEDDKKGSFRDLFRSPLSYALGIGIFLALCNQLVGQNAIFYYAPTIFSSIFPGGNTAFLCSAITGTVNVLATILGLYMIDRIGRKPLMMSGALGMCMFYVLMGLSMMFHWNGVLTLVFACMVIVSFAYSMGPITWVMVSELFPTYMRGRAAGFCTMFTWAANFLVAQLTPAMMTNWGGWTFIFWAVFDFLAFLGVRLFVPETKGRTLEQIQSFWTNKQHAKKHELVA